MSVYGERGMKVEWRRNNECVLEEGQKDGMN
jgi:hypothetical protein